MARKKKVGTAGILMAQGRKALGWSQEDLSHFSRVSKSGIAKHERGDRKALRELYAHAIADALTKGGFPVTGKQLLGQ